MFDFFLLSDLLNPHYKGKTSSVCTTSGTFEEVNLRYVWALFPKTYPTHSFIVGEGLTSVLALTIPPKGDDMSLPITGPYATDVIRNGTGLGTGNQWFRKKRNWYRQKRPYNLPLTFYMSDDAVTKYAPWGAWRNQPATMFYYNSASAPVDDKTSALYAKAWSNFRNEVSSSANLALTLIERRQAFDMITKRTLQFAKFIKEVRSFQFVKAANTLGVKRPRGLKTSAKKFGDNVLEYQFGWAPLITDCYQATQILSESFPNVFAKGRASTKSTSSSSGSYGAPGEIDNRTYTSIVESSYRLSAQVKVINPNLHLASQLGFTNPAVLAYESVPFSFILNWFVTLEEFLNGFYPFPGIELVNPFTSFKGTSTLMMSTQQRAKDPYGRLSPWYGYDASCRRVLVTRTPGPITGPSLRIRVPWNLSPSRGLNAVSLLLQRLR